MLRHLFVSTLIFCFFTSYSQASVQTLKSAYEELKYSLDVEWDQKDQDFKQKKIESFRQTVDKLQDQGLSNAELMDFALSEVKDPALKKEIQTLITMVKINEMGRQETFKMLKETLDKNSTRGASWNGETVMRTVGIILAIALVVYVISRPNESAPRPVGEQPDGSYCGYSEVCDYEYDYFYEEEVYQCWNEYHCVSY